MHFFHNLGPNTCIASKGKVDASPRDAKTCKISCSKVFCKKLNGIRISSSAVTPSVTAVDFLGSGYLRFPTFITAADITSPAILRLRALRANLRAGVATGRAIKVNSE